MTQKKDKENIDNNVSEKKENIGRDVDIKFHEKELLKIKDNYEKKIKEKNDEVRRLKKIKEQEKEEFLKYHKKHKTMSLFKGVSITIIIVAISLSVLFYMKFQDDKKIKEEIKNEMKDIEYNKSLFKKILLDNENGYFNSVIDENFNVDVDNLFIAKSVGIFLIERITDDKEVVKEIYLKNPEKKLSLASITKLMTAIIALEEMNNKVIEIKQEHLDEYGDSGLILNEKFLINKLVKLMLVVSSNDAAKAISMSYDSTEKSRLNFISKMNEKAEELQMKETLFFSESGLDTSDNVGGAYSNIYDLKKLVYYFYKEHGDIAKEISVHEKTINSLSLKKHELINTNKILNGDLEDKKYILSKTGYTDLTGGNLVVIYDIDNKNKLMILVINSTKKGRFADVLRAVKAGKEYMDRKI